MVLKVMLSGAGRKHYEVFLAKCGNFQNHFSSDSKRFSFACSCNIKYYHFNTSPLTTQSVRIPFSFPQIVIHECVK